jgi:hypothetical protein
MAFFCFLPMNLRPQYDWSHIVHMIWIDGSYDMVAARKESSTIARRELISARSIR